MSPGGHVVQLNGMVSWLIYWVRGWVGGETRNKVIKF